MRKRLQLFVAVFIIFAVTAAYSFDTQFFNAYAAEETSAQTDETLVTENTGTLSDGEQTSTGHADGQTEGEEDSTEFKAGHKETVPVNAGEETFETKAALSAVPDACDFEVTGDSDAYSFDEASGVLTITGDVTVSMKEGKTSTSQRIVVAASCTVTLDGVDIAAAEKSGPGILIQATNTVHLNLKEGSVNNVTGAHGIDINATKGGYAGIEVEFIFEDGENPSNQMASLIIEGSGVLNATGGPNAAGIGGSNSLNGSNGKGLYGNITINSGTVNAKAPGDGAGIGSSNNPGGGTSTGSYKKTGNNTWGTITINGGAVNAVSTNSGAGIGGGNHVDSGKVVISGGTVTANGAAGIGCGIGSSKNKGNASNDKGPGYYAADITITGGNITATSNDIGAAIGGGMYCDAVISISGGTIKATGGSREGKTHHGGAGIGGGYLGHAEIKITGGDITAVGGDGAAGIGSGGSPNSKEERGTNGRGTTDITTVDYTVINISGGTVSATGGEKGGAGIGLGVGADKGEINITGGNVTAIGAESQRFDEDVSKMAGGAGIGSGYSGIGSGNPKYFVEADVDISITGGMVTAIGGWGASGVGSGAQNKTANKITIDAENTDLQAYSDGTKFAIDTRQLNDDGTTTSITEGRTVSGNLIQGTFVHNYDTPDVKQSPEGLDSIRITNDKTGDSKTLTLMPDGYRSYATNVADPGTFTVYTDDESIGNGEGRYFSKQTTDRYDKKEAESKDNIVQYTVETGKLSDNFYLFPVKSVIVEKIVNGNPAEVNGLNTTVYFGVCFKDETGKTVFLMDNDKVWTKSIEIVNGAPQGKAYFVNLDDRTYDVREITSPDDTSSPIGAKFGSLTLSRITTQHGEVFPVSKGAEHGLAVTTSPSSTEGKIDITVKVSSAHDDDYSLSLSLFADGKLASDSMKLNSKNNWTYTWTADEKSTSGEVIEYGFADTSNNATIDETSWSDEVKVINTYEGDKKKLVIKKVLTDFVDHNNENLNNVNATFVFKIRGTYEKNSETKTYTNVVSMDFTKDGAGTQEVAVEGIPSEVDVEKLTVEEFYSGNYEQDPEADEPKVTKVEGKDGVYEITFKNKWSGDIVYKGGVTNKYEISDGVSRYLNPLEELTGGNQ